RSYRASHVRDGDVLDPRGRWWDFSGGARPLELLDRTERTTDAVLDYVWALPRGESTFVTVVVPELLRRPTLTAAMLGRRTTFMLKLRLLGETGLVAANVPVIDGRNAEAPASTVARVLVQRAHAATLRPVHHTRSPG